MERTGATGRDTFDPEPWRQELLDFVRRTAPWVDAEDVVQECFVRSIAAPPRSHPRAWLYRVAANVLRDGARRSKTMRAALFDVARTERQRNRGHEGTRADDPSAAAEARGLVEAARAIVAALPEKQRLCLLLRIQRHMDYDEIAIALDCSVPTARQHFHLAVKRVRDRLAETDDA